MASALILHCTLFLFLLVKAGLCDATDEYYNILDFAMERRHEQWMAEYGKEYEDEAERARRFEIFKKNVRYIEDFNNAGEYNYTLVVNKFADLSLEEFMAFYTGGVDRDPRERAEEFAWSSFDNKTIRPSKLPSSVDWRDEGVLNDVKNQRLCGSCWAFAAVATIESLNKIKNDVLYNLSEQQLVDCDMHTFNRGCRGGNPRFALLYTFRNGGLTTEANYPYKAVDGNCDAQKEKETEATVSGTVVDVAPHSKDALMAAVAKQPVAAFVRVTQNWKFFNGGVFSGPCGGGNLFNHFVVVVGYEAGGSSPYWILRNSWGSNWADGGYIKLAMDAGGPSGLCDILKEAVYPTL